MRRLFLVGVLFTFLLSGCGEQNDALLTALLPPSVLASATDVTLDYYPDDTGYFALVEMQVPEAVRTEWLNESFMQGDCQIFESLYSGDFVSEEWWQRAKQGSCYQNEVLMTNELANYNELTVLLYEDQVLLYAAGLNEVK